ncbi:MAG: hypothetical protein KAR40_14035 [Candidatus Sabulitectum sp.]|nr:hypothetical protein [Candidatus Sabulitectum sp.]
MYDERLDGKINDTKPDVAASAVERLVMWAKERALSAKKEADSSRTGKVRYHECAAECAAYSEVVRYINNNIIET